MQIKNVREIVKGCNESLQCEYCKCAMQECDSIIRKFKSAPYDLSESEIQQLEKGEIC